MSLNLSFYLTFFEVSNYLCIPIPVYKNGAEIQGEKLKRGDETEVKLIQRLNSILVLCVCSVGLSCHMRCRETFPYQKWIFLC